MVCKNVILYHQDLNCLNTIFLQLKITNSSECLYDHIVSGVLERYVIDFNGSAAFLFHIYYNSCSVSWKDLANSRLWLAHWGGGSATFRSLSPKRKYFYWWGRKAHTSWRQHNKIHKEFRERLCFHQGREGRDEPSPWNICNCCKHLIDEGL